METCANCGRAIGNLETPSVWNDRTVCAACRSHLERVSQPPALPMPALPIVQYHVAMPAPPRGKGLMWAGLIVLLASVPLVCIIGPFASIPFVVGLVLLIVGLCI